MQSRNCRRAEMTSRAAMLNEDLIDSYWTTKTVTGTADAIAGLPEGHSVRG